MRELDKLFQELRRRNMFRVAGAYAVVGWLLMQMAVVLETSLNLPSWFDTFVTVMVLIGLPVALFLAWAFELTPDGIRPTETVPDDQSIARATGRKLEYAILAGLFLIAGLMITDQFTHSDPPSPVSDLATSEPKNNPNIATETAEFRAPNGGKIARVQKASLTSNKSVAVLPFDNRSAVESDAFFAAGIHDDLLTQLSKMSAVQVISRTSVMGYADTDKKIPEIAVELGVAVVLEGAVQRGGERVLISAKLIDGQTDQTLWSERYDRELTTDNIFQIQSEITRVIADTLEAVLTQRDESQLGKPLTQSLSAYDHYIRGQLLAQQDTRTAEEFDTAIAAYDAAIADDPDFAAAWGKKADAQISRYWFTGRDVADRDAARVSLDRAEALAPDSAETLLPLARYYYWGLQDFDKASVTFDRAIKAAPNDSNVLAGKAFLDRRLGRFAEAASALEAAHRLDPKAYYLVPELALTRVLLGEFDAADAMIERAKLINPGSEHAAIFEAAVWQFQGKPDKAWDAIIAIDEGKAFRFYDQLSNYAIATGDNDKINLVLERWPEDKREPEKAPELYNLFKLRALMLAGDTEAVKAEQAAMKRRVKDRGDAYPEAWNANPHYSPLAIPGMVGDKKTVRAVVAAYESQAHPDAMIKIPQLADIADALARIGDKERALDYVDQVIDLTGPYFFLVIENEQGLESLRGHKRYQKIRENFEAWKRGNP